MVATIRRDVGYNSHIRPYIDAHATFSLFRGYPMTFLIKDVKTETFTNSTSIVAITLTHMPTGLTVSGSGKSQFRLKNSLMDKLENHVTLDAAYIKGKW